jgi:DNA-binding LacI/PurR family transcriptional regulator
VLRRNKTIEAAAPCEPGKPVNLKMLAAHLGLSIAAVSRILNGSPAARSIAPAVQERVFKTAKELGYKPNIFARSLRSRRSYTIGVMVAEVSEGYATLVLSGIEQQLLQEGYFYFVVSHHHRKELIKEYQNLLMARAVEGLVAVDSELTEVLPIPTVSISGHDQPEGVTNVVLDHHQAAMMAIGHLMELGHTKIAFLRGQDHTSDTSPRWDAIVAASRALNLKIKDSLVVHLQGNDPTPEPGFQATRELFHRREDFTALFAFNDMTAIGAMSAMQQVGCRIPKDVSVVGFDDIQTASFLNPGLTTVRQPLKMMGILAARTVLRQLQSPDDPLHAARKLVVEPELIVRGSTGPCPALSFFQQKRRGKTSG